MFDFSELFGVMFVLYRQPIYWLSVLVNVSQNEKKHILNKVKLTDIIGFLVIMFGGNDILARILLH